MKKSLVLLAALLPLLAAGQWRDPAGNPAPDAPSRKGNADFGVQLILTASPAEFRKQWNLPTPRLTTTDTVQIGKSLGAVLVFYGCQPGADGNCKVEAEFDLEQPGGIKMRATQGPVWLAKPPGRGIFMLGDVGVDMHLTVNDAPGVYTLIANVTDRVAKTSFQLRAPFTVTK